MSFQEIRRRLPFQLSYKKPGSSSNFQDFYGVYDVAIGGVPFLYKIDRDSPLIRSTAQFRKQQLDTSLEPGEQSLSGWWLRSQSSWHLGAGITYGDPELDESAPYRYADSEGIDPWTPGQVTLCKATSLLKPATGAVKMVTAMDGGQGRYYRVDGADVYQGDTSTGAETLVLDGTNPILDITTDGADIYVATADDIMKIPHGSGTPVQVWDLSGVSTAAIGWVKQRIVAGLNNSIYVPSFAGTALGTAVYSHPNTAWQWSDVVEGPEAIYVSGGVGSESVIIRLSLDETGTVPTLTNATVVAAFPVGEVVTSMHAYLGTYLGIGTNKGFRVATMGQGGSLQYGPLIETPAAVRAISARGNHFLVGFSGGFSDGGSGLLRVDLRNQMSSGAFPYAKDLQAHEAGQVDSIALIPSTGQALIGITDAGIYREHLNTLEPQGFLTTPRQRFNTVWPKLYKRFNVRGQFFGPLSVSTIDEQGTELSIVSLTNATDQSNDLSINYPDTPQEYLSLKFTLNRDPEDTGRGTVLRSYQLKALPGGPRPRQLTLPLLCFDFERDRHEQSHGFKGWAMQRLEAMEVLDSNGDAVLFQDLITNTAFLCTIEAMEYRQVDARGTNGSRWGGVLTIALRTLSS